MQPPDDLENTPLFDRKRVGNYVAFMRGALRRHFALAAIVFVTLVAVTSVILWSLPRSYHVEAKVLAHSNAALTVRADGPGSEGPTRTAAETILRRDALFALVDQHDLVRHGHEHRAPMERARDAITRWLGSQPETEQEQRDAIVELLEKRLMVWTNENGSTVTIAIDWPDPQMAVRIIDSAQQNYLESRYAQEVTALSESIGILQSHVEGSRADIDDAVVGLKVVRDEKDRPRSVDPVDKIALPAPPPLVRMPNVDAGLAPLKTSIDAKQRTLTELEDFRSHRLTDLQSRLAEQQAIYTESHPTVVDLKQAIAAMSGDSLQIKTLRTEIAGLEADYAQRAAATSSAHATYVKTTTPAAGPNLQLPPEVLRLDLDLRDDRDPNIMHARGQLRDAMDKFATLRTHIQSAEIDLETAKAAFKYRYTVITPAHVPKKPAKPNTTLITGASVLAALFLAWLLAIVADLQSGRLVDRWQLEKLLDRPIIADIELPQLGAPDPE
jgi:uncharacterized protein involved in exopolysaccharide biosynthesis